MTTISAFLPVPQQEVRGSSTPLYVGIDLGKHSHAYCLLSARLLRQHKTHQRCPQGTIKNERSAFEQFYTRVRAEAGERMVHILTEHTGHYGYAFEQFLQEQPGVLLYRTQARKRYGKNKTDKKDAQGLAVRLYNQVSLQTQVTDARERVVRLLPPIPEAAELHPLVSRRIDLSHALVQCENRLTSLLDQLFPELCEIFKEPNGPAPLNLRESFPTAQAVAEAELTELIATRHRTKPGNAGYARLRTLAGESIGLKAGARRGSLVIEQGQLIAQMRLLLTQQQDLDDRIAQIMTCREGQILQSIPGIGPVLSAQLLAGIGNIANFQTLKKFRAYVGWSPRQSQTGTTFDSSTLDRSGNKLCKLAIRQAALAAIRHASEWKALQARKVARGMRGSTALGHVAGHMAGIIYILLKQDETRVLDDAPALYVSSH